MTTQIHPSMSRANQAQLVELLKEARYTVGKEKLQSLLPEPFKVTIGAHDTGCQCYVELQAPGRSPLTVWQGSIWYSSSYEFNDRNKILGINPEYLFAQDALVRFFETVQSLHSEELAERSMKDAEKSAKATEQHQNDVEFYKSLVVRSA